eukprot:SAG25_NODE_719_length_5744_cov_4.938884_9_plen_152_part_00
MGDSSSEIVNKGPAAAVRGVKFRSLVRGGLAGARGRPTRRRAGAGERGDVDGWLDLVLTVMALIVNPKYSVPALRVPAPSSRADCQAGCDAAPACVGYTYRASGGGLCDVYGPGLDTDLAGGWTADTWPATTIGGASGGSAYVCAAVVGRN